MVRASKSLLSKRKLRRFWMTSESTYYVKV